MNLLASLFALPDPLHPAVVHFPIVLLLLAVPVAVAAVFRRPRCLPVVAAVLLGLGAVGAVVAVQTGEDESERVAETPALEAVLEEHEEWAERTQVVALVAAVRRDRKLISGWLEAGALTRVDDKTVQIGFPPEQAFSKDFLEQGHREFLTEAASTILGRNVRISLEVRDGVVATTPHSGHRREPTCDASL